MTSSLAVSALGSVYINTNVLELSQAVNSLLSGSVVPSEIVIVVDGPVSSSVNLYLSKLESPIFILVFLPSNVGLGLALASGLACCSGDLVLRFDTDDINHSSRLDLVLAEFNANPDLDIMGTFVYEFSSESFFPAIARIKKVPLSCSSIYRTLNWRNPINHPSVVFRKSSIEAIGSYEHMPFYEDYFLWLKARSRGLIMRNLSIPTVFMRRDSLNLRRSGYIFFLAELRFSISCIRFGLVSLPVFFLFLFRSFLRTLLLPELLLAPLMFWRTSPKRISL